MIPIPATVSDQGQGEGPSSGSVPGTDPMDPDTAAAPGIKVRHKDNLRFRAGLQNEQDRARPPGFDAGGLLWQRILSKDPWVSNGSAPLGSSNQCTHPKCLIPVDSERGSSRMSMCCKALLGGGRVDTTHLK